MPYGTHELTFSDLPEFTCLNCELLTDNESRQVYLKQLPAETQVLSPPTTYCEYKQLHFRQPCGILMYPATLVHKLTGEP